MRGERVCLGKEPFDTHSAATGAMYGLINDGQATRRDMKVYRCPLCGWFHIGHRIGFRRRNR